MSKQPLSKLEKRTVLIRVIEFYNRKEQITYTVAAGLDRTLKQDAGFCTLIVYFSNLLFKREFMFMSECVPEILPYRPKSTIRLYWFERGDNWPRIEVLKKCLDNDLI